MIICVGILTLAKSMLFCQIPEQRVSRSNIHIYKDTEMTDIPNTEYITINKDGIFVGGKTATTYRGEKIWWINKVCDYFAGIQKLKSNVAELHVLSSETCGEYAVAGNPSGKHGPNAWCRVKFNDGRIGSWVFAGAAGSVAACAYGCAYYCAADVRGDAAFRPAVLGAIDKEKTSQKPINPVAVAINNEAQNKR